MTAANLFDKLASRVLLFLIATYLYSLVLPEPWVYLTLAALTLASFELVLLILSKNNKLLDRSLKRRTLRTLSLSSAEENLALFARALESYAPERKSDRLLFSREGKPCALFLRFEHPLTDRDVAECVRAGKDAQEIYILCRTAEYQGRVLADAYESKPVILYEQADVFRLLKKHETFPTPDPVQKKPHFSRVVTRMFAPKNVKSYVLSAGIILLFSLFSPLRVYYYVASGACLVLALVCLVKRGRSSLPDVL